MMLSKKQYLETVLTADQDTILKNYVAGEFITSDNLFDDINPVDGTLVAKVAEAGKAALSTV